MFLPPRAGPVYRLLGKKDMGTTEFPEIETTLTDGEVAFRQHKGAHSRPEQPTFLKFADRYIKSPPAAGATSDEVSGLGTRAGHAPESYRGVKAQAGGRPETKKSGVDS
jgi:hypothetical protein